MGGLVIRTSFSCLFFCFCDFCLLLPPVYEGKMYTCVTLKEIAKGEKTPEKEVVCVKTGVNPWYCAIALNLNALVFEFTLWFLLN